jgi:tRNA(Ser,Leu) C12 N-acetylase TAN1
MNIQNQAKELAQRTCFTAKDIQGFKGTLTIDCEEDKKWELVEHILEMAMISGIHPQTIIASLGFDKIEHVVKLNPQDELNQKIEEACKKNDVKIPTIEGAHLPHLGFR